MKINKILCPVDFSDHSKRALEYAAFIAIANHATLILLHVIEHMHNHDHFLILNLMPEELNEKLKEQAREKLTLLAHPYQSSVTVETAIRTGKPFVEIVKMAKEFEIDQIVMGSHGRTGISHLLIGSVAEKVTRKAPCPVLIFKQKGKKFDMP